MWISILNYNMGQIEVADITDFDADIDKDSTEDFAENNVALTDDERATDWLESNDYCPDEVGYMLTDECPLCVVNNVETHLNL